MKPKEFYKIMEEFVEEEKFWRGLKKGQTIYQEVGRGDSFDYHKMKIDGINIEERYVVAHDVEGDHTATIYGFITEEMFEKL